MAKNKIIKLLSDNKPGAIIGAVLFYLSPTFISLNLFVSVGQEMAVLIGNAISIFFGALLGAFIQSKMKR